MDNEVSEDVTGDAYKIFMRGNLIMLNQMGRKAEEKKIQDLHKAIELKEKDLEKKTQREKNLKKN